MYAFNKELNISVKVANTVKETIESIKEKGAKIGKTSLSDLIAGRKEQACGFVLVETNPLEPVEPVKQDETVSKSQKAQIIFDEMYKVETPKNIKLALMAEAGLTKNGAHTYYYNMKSKADNK